MTISTNIVYSFLFCLHWQDNIITIVFINIISIVIVIIIILLRVFLLAITTQHVRRVCASKTHTHRIIQIENNIYSHK